ncbi:MAG: hypothetical protein WC080_02140 [Patescibacteria group bacterium]
MLLQNANRFSTSDNEGGLCYEGSVLCLGIAGAGGAGGRGLGPSKRTAVAGSTARIGSSALGGWRD